MLSAGETPAAVPPSAPQQSLLARLKHWTGLDRAIAFTVMARGWAAVGGVISVLLIAKFLSPAEQGYYFTFASLVAMQIIFELGFSFVILQLAAHERAHLKFEDGEVQGDPIAHARIASILQKSVRWYSIAALLMLGTVLPMGYHFFATHQRGGVDDWQGPWCLLVLAAGLTFQIDPVFSFLEGCGFVAPVARMRFSQATCASVFAWTALITHHGLYAPAAMIFGQGIVGAMWLFTRRKLLLHLLRFPVGEHAIGWTTEIWPFQWRIAISWLCGYFVFQLFNPVIFAYQGAVAAGQMGMSLSIMMSMGAVALSWMNTKASPFGAMVAKGEFARLDHLFFRTLKQSAVLLSGGAIVVLSCVVYASNHYPRLAIRVLPPLPFALLLATALGNHIVFCESVYLRAHKREPFMIQAIVNALLVGTSTYFLGRYAGMTAVALGYFLASGVTGLIIGTYIFVTKRREWHEGVGADQIGALSTEALPGSQVRAR